MKTPEGLRIVGKAAEYLTGLDVPRKAFIEMGKNEDEARLAPTSKKLQLHLRNVLHLTHSGHKWVAVIPYRWSGLDLATRGIRKLTSI